MTKPSAVSHSDGSMFQRSAAAPTSTARAIAAAESAKLATLAAAESARARAAAAVGARR